MTLPSRQRLARIVRRPRCDLAEAALLCCVEITPDLDVDAELLRLDAFADQLRSRGFRPGTAVDNAAALRDLLAVRLGFAGDHATYHDPRNGLLTAVLDRRLGLPITLSILYVAVAERVGIPAFGINTPGHFLVGVSGAGAPRGSGRDPQRGVVVIDPFHGGEVVSEAQIDERIRAATGGATGFNLEMVRPASAPSVIRRLLNNLTRDFLAEGDAEDALWTVELKRLLPGSGEDDARAAGELLTRLGRYRAAAEALEEFVAKAPPGEDTEALARLAARARAKMN